MARFTQDLRQSFLDQITHTQIESLTYDQDFYLLASKVLGPNYL